MSSITESLAQDPELLIPIIAISGVFIAGIIAIIFGTIMKMTTTQQREQSRREIAAYVAEGSMTPEDAQNLINAGDHQQIAQSGKGQSGKCCMS
tara:strand:- start:721996 stop:722277 length:282 start_codon:yes stop_codon:yes gene_type:complete